MDVFVEANFVLELAFQQAHYEACTRILAGAVAGSHTLHVPQYALTEVFHTLHHRRNERLKNREYFRQEITQHRREAEADATETDLLVQLLTGLLATRTQVQTDRLFAVTTIAVRADLSPQDSPLHLTAFNDFEDELVGALGTPERTAYEALILSKRADGRQDADSEASVSY